MGFKSRVSGFFASFFGLTQAFKVVIASNILEAFGSPQWFSIYLKQDLGANEEAIGLVNAVKGAARLLLYPFGGVVGQRINRKQLFMMSIFIGIPAYLIAFFAVDWTWTVLMMIVLGCRALVMPGVQALAGEITNRATRATVFALDATLISIVIVLRSPLQGMIAETLGLRYLYLSGGIALTGSLLIVSKYLPDIKKNTSNVKSDKQPSKEVNRKWVEEVRKVFAVPNYRRNFAGLILTGTIWRLFYIGLLPFLDIYLYEEIGWGLLFFGFYGSVNAFLAVVLRIPFGKLMDKYYLKRVLFSLGPVARGIAVLLLIFTKDPFLLAAILLINSVVDLAYTLSLTALWYDAIPLESYPTGVAIRGVIYGLCNIVGSLLVAHLWVHLGPPMSFCIISTTQIASSILAFSLVRDIRIQK